MVDTLSREPTAKMIEQGLIYLPGVDPDQLRDAWRIMWDMAQQEPGALSREDRVRAEERERCAGIAANWCCTNEARGAKDTAFSSARIAEAIRSALPSLRASGHEGGGNG